MMSWDIFSLPNEIAIDFQAQNYVLGYVSGHTCPKVSCLLVGCRGARGFG